MTYWLDIKEKLKNNIGLAMQLLLLVLGIYLFIMADKHSLWKIPMIFVGLFILFFLRNKTKHPLIWIVFFILLIFDLYHYYFRVANHHFVLTFMVLSVILYYYHHRKEILLKNIQMLLVIVLMASAVQKLLSSQFMSGEFYYYLMNRGYLFNTFFTFFPESLEVVKSNTESILALQDTDPNLSQSIVLHDVFSDLGFFSLVYAWITVVLEFIVAIALLWKPKSMWTHLLFTTLIIGILCARLETGFIALLAICGLFLCSNLKLRLLYVLIAIGSVTLIVTKIGFH